MAKDTELTDEAVERLAHNFIEGLRALAADDYDGRDAVVAKGNHILENPNSFK